MCRDPDEVRHVEALAEQIVATLKRSEAERLARYRRPASRPWRVMTREELAEAYKRAGVFGPMP